MIRINLLPHREMRRTQRKKDFVTQASVVAGCGVAVALAVGYLINSQIDSQVQRNEFIQARNADLDSQIKEIANLQSEIESLRARQTSVERLQSNRTIPVHLFDELVRVVPEGVYLTKLTQTDRQVALVGHAQTTERIADLLRSLVSDAPSMEKPQLGEIKAITLKTGDVNRPDERRLFEFSMNVLVKELVDPDADKASHKKPPGTVASN